MVWLEDVVFCFANSIGLGHDALAEICADGLGGAERGGGERAVLLCERN